ncbi:hypothetical protein [Neptunomonas qingdaonensis]|uniref:Uncharacterized protein n=1 Tax=Neptunomonas qingdaonensis TaxID=1045558 RepID=A0A1I2SAI8_9GAMM|nr:hypothetical protein [Neptunomonas qingdaonensis]SFG47907.1 hypothetical protein SAMN05216175_107116 [Neptunomonas qingdaonensis]
MPHLSMAAIVTTINGGYEEVVCKDVPTALQLRAFSTKHRIRRAC